MRYLIGRTVWGDGFASSLAFDPTRTCSPFLASYGKGGSGQSEGWLRADMLLRPYLRSSRAFSAFEWFISELEKIDWNQDLSLDWVQQVYWQKHGKKMEVEYE